MTPIDQVPVATFAQAIARPGRRYRIQVGGRRILEIEGDQVRDDRGRTVPARDFARKRIVAFEAITPPARPASRKRKSK